MRYRLLNKDKVEVVETESLEFIKLKQKQNGGFIDVYDDSLKCWTTYRDHKKKGNAMRILLILLCIFSTPSFAAKTPKLTDDTAIRSIIGEAEDEGRQGMAAVACTIANRGTLKGVYGHRVIFVRNGEYYRRTKKNGNLHVSDKVVQNAKEVWDIATHAEEYMTLNRYGAPTDMCYELVKGATGWGSKSDLALFKKESWWKDCIVVAQVKGHYFYRRKTYEE